LNRDINAPPDLDDDDDLDGESHAADEPTAVWDESALRAAGLTDLLQRRDEPASPPATRADRASDTAPSIVVEDVPGAGGPGPVIPADPAPSGALARGLGWGATLLVAIALGAAVYLLVRYLRG
jgi:hypothetical protein